MQNLGKKHNLQENKSTIHLVVPVWKRNLLDAMYNITSLGKEFSLVINLLFRPVALLSFFLAGLTLYWSQGQTGNNKIIFDVIATLIAGICGSIITSNFLEITGNTYVIKKSMSAIRNLQLIKFKVSNISMRISNLRKLSNKKDLEEIDNLVQNVHKDIINSIGDWDDVNPASKEITDNYELVAQKEIQVKVLENQVRNLDIQKNKIARANTESITKITKMEDDINKKNSEINKLRQQIENLNLGSSGLVSVSPSVSIGRGSSSYYSSATYPANYATTTSTSSGSASFLVGDTGY